MTPKEVKQKRNDERAPAAASAGASSGSVTLRSRRHGPAPSVAAASQARVGRAPPRRADDPHDDGDVEEDVGGEDRPDPALVASGSSGQERGRDDDRRQHERHEHERPHERAAGEAKRADRPGERQPDERA